MTFGFSRDDIGGFVPDYLDKKMLPADPFQILDQEGVGQLVEMAVQRGRATRPKLKVGICGEHGGEPSSVEFCHMRRDGLRLLLAVPRADRAARGGAGAADASEGSEGGHRAPGAGHREDEGEGGVRGQESGVRKDRDEGKGKDEGEGCCEAEDQGYCEAEAKGRCEEEGGAEGREEGDEVRGNVRNRGPRQKGAREQSQVTPVRGPSPATKPGED